MINILFLEDDVVLAETVVDFLEDEDFEVTHVKDGSEAIAKSKLNSFDLYLFDVNVPMMNGFEVLTRLREEGDGTPTFFLTALSDIGSMGEGFEAGADDYIKKPFDPEELLLRIRMKLKNSQKVHRLESELLDVTKKSQEDFLTKLYNRRALETKLEELEYNYKNSEEDFAFIFIDIDFFKKINDTYGHDTGDEVLAWFASLLRESSREEDFIARYGGEEFVSVLPKASLPTSVKFAEKIRQSIQATEFHSKEHTIHLTMSSGVALRSSVESVESLIKKADNCVYEAKRSGRNKVVT